jgi:hypothetical protein
VDGSKRLVGNAAEWRAHNKAASSAKMLEGRSKSKCVANLFLRESKSADAAGLATCSDKLLFASHGCHGAAAQAELELRRECMPLSCHTLTQGFPRSRSSFGPIQVADSTPGAARFPDNKKIRKSKKDSRTPRLRTVQGELHNGISIQTRLF